MKLRVITDENSHFFKPQYFNGSAWKDCYCADDQHKFPDVITNVNDAVEVCKSFAKRFEHKVVWYLDTDKDFNKLM